MGVGKDLNLAGNKIVNAVIKPFDITGYSGSIPLPNGITNYSGCVCLIKNGTSYGWASKNSLSEDGWTFLPGSGTITGANTVGSGIPVYASVNAGTLSFKGFTGIGSITITNPDGPTGPVIINSSGGSGATGYTGYTGPNGTQGPTGDTGLQGSTGYTGYTGPRGFQGFTGSSATYDCCAVFQCLVDMGLIRREGGNFRFGDAVVFDITTTFGVVPTC